MAGSNSKARMATSCAASCSGFTIWSTAWVAVGDLPARAAGQALAASKDRHRAAAAKGHRPASVARLALSRPPTQNHPVRSNSDQRMLVDLLVAASVRNPVAAAKQEPVQIAVSGQFIADTVVADGC